MINKAGGVKSVDVRSIDELKAKGWVMLPQRELDSAGNPKQVYYPQYDVNHMASQNAPDEVKPIEESNVTKNLSVELF